MLTMGNTRKKRTGLGKKLTDLRDRLKLSQLQAAQKLGVTLKSWARWERNEIPPNRAYLALIRQELGEF